MRLSVSEYAKSEDEIMPTNHTATLPVLGLERGNVRLSAYNSEWLSHYQDEMNLILSLSDGNLPLALEHIGSTAIPGTIAKPILDIMIGVPTLDFFSPVNSLLQKRGYTYEGEKNGIPNRDFYTLGTPCTHHVHVVLQGGEFWTNQIIFREYLKANAHIAQDYGSLKSNLAKRHPYNRNAYTNGKTQFIEETLAKAFTNKQ